MPAKISMILSNGNRVSPTEPTARVNTTVLTSVEVKLEAKPPSSLAAPMITRVHNVKSGCSSCGR